ncbi:MAG: hypothetical protein QXL17_01485 [Candidatus Thermoplasmatota archaeon]
MKKVLSLKLTAEEEEIVNRILKQGISPTTLMREALINYFSSVYQPVYQKQQEKIGEAVYQPGIPVYQNQEKTVYQPVYQKQQEKNEKKVYQNDTAVYQNQEKTVYQPGIPVYQNQEKVVYQQEEKPVYHTGQQPINVPHDYLNQYINELSLRTKQLEEELQEWKKRYTAQEQYLRDTYTTFQTEYYTQVKDSIKRLDDKFDRIMFYLEETRKPSIHDHQIHHSLESHVETTIPNIPGPKDQQKKPKKGWVFKMYRM